MLLEYLFDKRSLSKQDDYFRGMIRMSTQMRDIIASSGMNSIRENKIISITRKKKEC